MGCVIERDGGNSVLWVGVGEIRGIRGIREIGIMLKIIFLSIGSSPVDFRISAAEVADAKQLGESSPESRG